MLSSQFAERVAMNQRTVEKWNAKLAEKAKAKRRGKLKVVSE